jgi:hypothetical protein
LALIPESSLLSKGVVHGHALLFPVYFWSNLGAELFTILRSWQNFGRLFDLHGMDAFNYNFLNKKREKKNSENFAS